MAESAVDQPWAHIEQIVERISKEFPDAVFIGGVAVYHYAERLGAQALLETSHDADFYLSIVAKSAMRERYEMQRNPHLGKDSVIVEGEDLDIYVEHQHRLAVPYDEAATYAEMIGNVRVASLEHLLILKVDAARDRMGTAKGEKDLRDIARIIALLIKPRPFLTPYLTGERVAVLDMVIARSNLFASMGLGAHEASRLTKRMRDNAAAVTRLAAR